ncbi:hypothetical protein [Flavobacterium sp.]|uniref:hypothetical protein n=1 Tax=Flavobacterium sp. TaxID=239 RepID=UPI00286B4525|nr:hypothetical protein [Flavobacterium sp.]
MKKYFLVLSLFIFLSCKKEEYVPDGLDFYFENPQPINDAELSKIPNKFKGLFMNSDSVYLNINENIILKESFFKFKFHKKYSDSLENEFIFSNGKYISKDDNEVFDYRLLKDSIEFSNKQIDTFFIFSATQKAKRFDGKLVLNYKDSIYWKIKSISIEKTSLKIKFIYSKQDLKRIDSLTKVKSIRLDSSSFIFKPSRTEFKRILNLKKLGGEFEYRKISK